MWLKKITNWDVKCAKRSVKMWTTSFCQSFSKNILLYMCSRLSKIRSGHVMPRTVYFGWICISNCTCFSEATRKWRKKHHKYFLVHFWNRKHLLKIVFIILQYFNLDNLKAFRWPWQLCLTVVNQIFKAYFRTTIHSVSASDYHQVWILLNK